MKPRYTGVLVTVLLRIPIGKEKKDLYSKDDMMGHDAISCLQGLPCCEIVDCSTFKQAIEGLIHEGLHHTIFMGFVRYGDPDMLEDIYPDERSIDKLEKEKDIDIANIVLRWCR